MAIIIKSSKEIEVMREAGRITAAVLYELKNKVEPGMKTRDLDDIAVKATARLGAVPSFKGYHGYPASVCVSVNDEIVHGIPASVF